MTVATEVRVRAVVPHLDDAAVTAAMDTCIALASRDIDLVDWSISADLGAGTLSFWLLLDCSHVAAGEQHGVVGAKRWSNASHDLAATPLATPGWAEPSKIVRAV